MDVLNYKLWILMLNQIMNYELWVLIENLD